MNKKTRITLTLLCLIIAMVRLSAYSPHNHTLITRQAIKLLNDSMGYKFITDIEADAIVRGNESEDMSLWKGLIRGRNQHFYNPEKPDALRTDHQSINRRFERIARRMFLRTGRRNYYQSVGEVVHHIQDVTNPAHVVPVYHDFVRIQDAFDKQDVSKYFPSIMLGAFSPNLHITLPYCNCILKPVAEKTLSNITKKILVTVDDGNNRYDKLLDWSYFWRGNTDGWFGSYGLLGAPTQTKGRRIDNYLSNEIKAGNDTYYITSKTYDDFSRQQVRLAIVKTVEFIYYAKKCCTHLQ